MVAACRIDRIAAMNTAGHAGGMGMIAGLWVRMFKLGISRKKQLRRGHLDGLVNGRKYIALDLYDSLDDFSEAEIDKIQERILRWFRTDNGVQKRTYVRRFDHFDQLSLSAIAASFSGGQVVRVHDIGASDGRSSCGFYDALNCLFGERLEFLASDYAPYLYVLKRTRSTNRLIIDEQQHVLQIIAPPFVFMVGRAGKKKVYHPLTKLLTAVYVRPLLEDHKARRADIEMTRLELLSRQCRARISENHNFRFESYDVLSSPTERFDIIRAMNVLNYSYFSEAKLRKAMQNIFQSINDGGLFITGSNLEQGTTVNGAVYKKTNDRLQRIEISGGGSYIDALISKLGGVDHVLHQ
jgi:CheR methyltransferase, SAM binding domain